MTETRLVPIAGPPDLEGVNDEEEFFFVVSDGNYMEVLSAEGCRNSPVPIAWHIPLGVIEAPAEPLPKCPVCGEGLRVDDCNRHFTVFCDGQEKPYHHSVHFYGATEAEAIAAARRQG